jgi:hypothetical protein
MKTILNQNFLELSREESENINGGMAPAALYALGFVMGTNPLTALVACGGAVVAGVGGAIAYSKAKK